MGNKSSKNFSTKTDSFTAEYPRTEQSQVIYEEHTVTLKDSDEKLTYAGEEFYTNVQGVRATLEKYGIAIIPNVLSEEECIRMNEGMWSTVEHVTSKMEVPVQRSDPSTYASLFKLKPMDGAGLFHDFGCMFYTQICFSHFLRL